MCDAYSQRNRIAPMLWDWQRQAGMVRSRSAHVSAEKLAELFEPMAYQGVSRALIDRLLASLEDK
jgi:hypothetical protein